MGSPVVEDEWSRLERLNRDPAPADEEGMSLEAAVLYGQATLGMDWYHRPGYWPTRDGCVPYRVFLATMRGLGMLHAAEQLRIAGAVALTRAQDDGRAAEQLRQRAMGR